MIMEERVRNTLSKAERLNSKLAVEALFTDGVSARCIYPLRATYLVCDQGKAPVSILISVPKRKFRHAVDRNRMKRQVREAYRVRKHRLCALMEERGQSLSVAFVCVADKPCSSSAVAKSVAKLLGRIEDNIMHNA